METTFEAVILANGTFPTHAVPLDILHHAAHLIACDGAFTLLPSGGVGGGFLGGVGGVSLGEVVVIGDGDSLPAAFHDRLIRIDEQDDNDLTKATRYCLQRGWHRIAYLGCTGKREDHTLGNISLLMRYFRDMQVDAVMFTDHGFFTPVFGHHTFTSHPGQQVSIFNFGCTKLTSEGLKWNSYAYSQLWQGTLNEAVGLSFSFCADGYYLVFQTY